MPEKKHLFDDPRNVRSVLWALIAVCGLLFAADFIFHRHVVHPWEALWGVYAVFGFIACTVLLLVAKEMRKFLMRKEDYYDGDD